ncbi:MAG TPA: porin family protein [Flavisolibacter sp.]
MKYLIPVFLLIASAVANAQTNVNFGIKAGVNLANYNDDANTSSSRTSFHGGAFANFKITPNWAFQPELVYSMQGAKFIDSTLKTSYLHVPLVLQFLFTSNFRLQTGVQVGWLTLAEVEKSGGNVDRKSVFNSTDVSLLVGGGILFTERLGVDARFNFGLNDARSDNLEIKNRVWQIGAYYQLFK